MTRRRLAAWFQCSYVRFVPRIFFREVEYGPKCAVWGGLGVACRGCVAVSAAVRPFAADLGQR